MSAIRNDNEIIVVFDDDRIVETPPLFQYDKGIIIEFRDVPDLVDVQFSSIYTNETINKTIIDGKVTIPDSLLEELSGIVAYIKYINADSEWTGKVLSIPIKQRQKPSDYITEEDEPSFRSDMQQIMEDTKQIAEDTKELVENLELTDEQINDIANRIDLSNKVNIFKGKGAPSGNASLYPNVTHGDLYFDQNNTSNAYMAVYFPSSSAVGWSILPLQGYLINNYYKKTDVDYKIVEVGNNFKNYYNKSEVENLIKNAEADLSDFYNKTEIDDKFADLEYLESEDLLDRVKIFKGTSAPSRATSRYPDVKVGDIYINTDDLNQFYMAVIINGPAMTWANIPNVSGIAKYYYTKLETDEMLSNYDTSEEVDTKIEEALNNIPIAEGSEF